MKSMRPLSLLMEGFLLIVIFVIFMSLLSAVSNQARIETALSLEESINNLDASIDLYLEDRRQAFKEVSAAVDAQTDHVVVTSFSDVYMTSPDYKVTKIFKQDEDSLIYSGFDQSYTNIGRYLVEHPDEESLISPILKSPEFSYPSLYFVERKSNQVLFGRLSIEDLSDLLNAMASNLGGTIVIASEDGYILSTTSIDLPFHVIPERGVQEYNGYWITRHITPSLGNEIILIKSIGEIDRIADAIRAQYPIYIVIIMVVMFVKFLAHDMLMIRPIRRFVDNIISWSVDHTPERPEGILMRTREFDTLYEKFEEKTTSIQEAFDEVNNARKKAIEAELDLKASEEELQAMNMELESRIEKRSNELQQAYEQLVEQEKMASIGALVAGVSHEINTPIGICVTTSSFIERQYAHFREKYDTGEATRTELELFFKEMEESFQILSSSLLRASELINSFKQVAVGQSVEIKSEFKLREQIDLLIVSLKHEYKYKGHYFIVDCSPDIVLNSYLGAYMQIFTNLIMNALIHGLEEREQGEIKILVEANGTTLSIVFSDNGSGIDTVNLHRIFEPYFTTNREGGGSGLGLFIVYSLVTQKLGGSLHCDSFEGKGTTFSIEIPNQVRRK